MQPLKEVFFSSLTKIAIIGVSDSGKSTLGRLLSERLDITYTELDPLAWGPNWIRAPSEIFLKNLKDPY